MANTDAATSSTAMKLKTSVLLTGANGCLGTRTALQIASQHPTSHHLLLAVRDPADEFSGKLCEALDTLGNGVTYSLLSLKLGDLAKVREFVTKVMGMLDSMEVPPLGAIINCAARIAYDAEPYTVDGFHPIYQINYLMLKIICRIDVLSMYIGCST
jgi:NAD(P)-dependent dehydrogenase (short-subunit alcohol dehydrogenase family)